MFKSIFCAAMLSSVAFSVANAGMGGLTFYGNVESSGCRIIVSNGGHMESPPPHTLLSSRVDGGRPALAKINVDETGHTAHLGDAKFTRDPGYLSDVIFEESYKLTGSTSGSGSGEKPFDLTPGETQVAVEAMREKGVFKIGTYEAVVTLTCE